MACIVQAFRPNQGRFPFNYLAYDIPFGREEKSTLVGKPAAGAGGSAAAFSVRPLRSVEEEAEVPSLAKAAGSSRGAILAGVQIYQLRGKRAGVGAGEEGQRRATMMRPLQRPFLPMSIHMEPHPAMSYNSERASSGARWEEVRDVACIVYEEIEQKQQPPPSASLQPVTFLQVLQDDQ